MRMLEEFAFARSSVHSTASDDPIMSAVSFPFPITAARLAGFCYLNFCPVVAQLKFNQLSGSGLPKLLRDFL